jgi:hypothetical protein
MDKVNAGEKKISAKQWPSMFYDMSLYDPKNKKKGFLRSRVVIQVVFLSHQHHFLTFFVLGMAPYFYRSNVCFIKRAHWPLIKAGKGENAPSCGARDQKYHVCRLSGNGSSILILSATSESRSSDVLYS